VGGVVRTLAAWCPDWPVTAAGFGADVPVAVVAAGRVVACSAAARDAGVLLGMRRRAAEASCPGLRIVRRDEGREARAFEPVVVAVSALVPAVEVTRPGLLSLAVFGPARYHGGEQPLAAAVAARAQAAVAAACGVPEPVVQVGIADGPFAAGLAARRQAVVPPSGTAAFLAPFPVTVLGRPELAGLLVRLGIRTLGALAALEEGPVAARFGPEGVRAHRLARGLDDRPLRLEAPPAALVATAELDPPAERVDVAAFAGRRLGQELAVQLEAAGLACTLLEVEIETEHGERLVRRWRAEVDLDASAMGERLRWQLEGWLSGTAVEAPSAGVTRLQLRAVAVAPAAGRQVGFWGGRSDADRRAVRGLDRLRAMLGPEAVLTGMVVGGRGPGDRALLVPWGDTRPAAPERAPWPGAHPVPPPALVHRPPRPALVTGGDGRPVGVSARGCLSGLPEQVAVEGGRPSPVVAWAGPWLYDERWWDPPARRRLARFQLVDEDQHAYLCCVERTRWFVEATYD